MSNGTIRAAWGLLLTIFVGRIVLTYRVFNDTIDESGHIRAGLEVFERGSYTGEAQHPPLARVVIAALPYYLGGLRGTWAQQPREFYWRALSLARAGNLLFAALLFAVVYCWTRDLWGERAGLGACLLLVCCPNVIAHAGLATLDIGATATTMAALYCFWRWGWGLASGAALGVACLTKISALFLLPPLLATYLLAARRRIRAAKGAAALALVFVVIWAGYGFQVGMIVPPGHGFHTPYAPGSPDSLPNTLLRWVGDVNLPAYRFVHGIIELLIHNEAGHRAYLLGRLSDHGWWYYFPVALAVKSTIPMLLLAALGIMLWRQGMFFPVAGIVLILALSMTSRLNLGVRYVLALYPLFAMIGAAALAGDKRRWARPAALVLMAWHAGESVAAHPDYLPYFNELARGRGERFLLDSNLDWGQDLARLGQFCRDRDIREIHLSYFGLTDPEKMGVPARRLEPERPASGWVAVSVNNLIGLYNSPADFAWLRGRRPAARVGRSIWVYDLRGGP